MSIEKVAHQDFHAKRAWELVSQGIEPERASFMADTEYDVLTASRVYRPDNQAIMTDTNAGAAPVAADIAWEQSPNECDALVERVKNRGY